MPVIDDILDDIQNRLDANAVIVNGIRHDTDIARDQSAQALIDIVAARINVRGYTDTRIQEVYDFFLTHLTAWAESIISTAGGYADTVGDTVRNDISTDIGQWREWIDSNVADIIARANALDQFAQDTWDVEIPRILALVDTWTEEVRQIEQDVLNEVATLKNESDEIASRWRGMADDLEDAKARIIEFDYSLYEVKDELHQNISAEFDGRFANYDDRITVVAGEIGSAVTRVNTLEASYEDQAATIQNLEMVLVSETEQLAQQISSLSVGTNTQFDPFQIWHFDENREGWSGTWNNGYVRTGTSTTRTGLSIDASRYRQVRARIRRIGNPTWDAELSWAGATPAGPVTITEPTWIEDGSAHFGEITVNTEWAGTLTALTLTLGPSVDNDNYWLLDWITVGRPAPGASSADITTERSARQAADGVMAGRIEVLETSFNSLESDISAQALAITGINSSIEELDDQITVINSEITLMESAINNPTTGLSAMSTAVQTLTNRMDVTEDGITAVNSRIDNMEINVDDVINSSAFQALVQRVDQNENQIDVSNSSITSLTASVSTLPGSISAAQAAADAAATLAGSKGRVFVQNAAPTGADRDAKNLWIDTTGGNNTPKRWLSGAWVAVTDKVARDAAEAAAQALAGLGNKADATAVASLTQRISDAEGLLSSTSSDIVTLGNSITAQSTQITNAQQAANAASQLAGSKGKVLIQNTTPASADRAAQNLWIDTTGGNNTPKRWTGSTWAAVTDKAATDALAAANAAGLALQNKADSSAVAALTSRVAETETGLVSTGRDIVNLNNSLTVTNTNVTNAQQAAQAAADAAGNKGEVIYRSTAPTAAQRLPQNLWIDTTGGNNIPKRWNGSTWVAVRDKAATDALAAANAANSALATKADASAVTALSNTVTQQGNLINSTSNAVTNITNRINNASTGLTALAAGISSLNSSVVSLNGTVSSLSSSITGVQSQVNQSSANGQIRMRAIASPAGSSSRIAIVANASAAANQHQAGIWIDVNDNNTNDVIIQANRFAIVDGSGAGRPKTVPFFTRNGVTYLREAVIDAASIGSAHIKNLAVDTIHIKDGAITTGIFINLSDNVARGRNWVHVRTVNFNGPGFPSRGIISGYCHTIGQNENRRPFQTRVLLNGAELVIKSPQYISHTEYEGGSVTNVYSSSGPTKEGSFGVPINGGQNTLRFEVRNTSSVSWDMDIVFFRK